MSLKRHIFVDVPKNSGSTIVMDKKIIVNLPPSELNLIKNNKIRIAKYAMSFSGTAPTIPFILFNIDFGQGQTLASTSTTMVLPETSVSETINTNSSYFALPIAASTAVQEHYDEGSIVLSAESMNANHITFKFAMPPSYTTTTVLNYFCIWFEY